MDGPFEENSRWAIPNLKVLGLDRLMQNPLSHEAELRKIDFLRNWSLQDNNPNFLRKSLYEAALNGRSEDVQYLADLSDNHKCSR